MVFVFESLAGVLEFLTGVPEQTIANLRKGILDEDALRKVAGPLGLDPATLVERAKGTWTPEPVELDGLRQFQTPYEDVAVNSYLVWDPTSKVAALFDTGTDASGALVCSTSATLVHRGGAA